MLGSVGSVVPKRWILGIFALGLIAFMVSTSANPWAGADTVPIDPEAAVASPTSITVTWTPADAGSTLPASGDIDGYIVSCLSDPGLVLTNQVVATVGASSHTVTGLDSSTAYDCLVTPAVGVSPPSTDVSFAGTPVLAKNAVTKDFTSVVTPATLTEQLGSVAVSPASGDIQVGGAAVFTATAKAADTDETIITGLPVTWSISGNGSLGTPFGPDNSQVTYTASSAGSATITASVKQSVTGITKSLNAVATNFTPPASTSPPTGTDPTDPADIPAAPSLGGETQASTGVIMPSTGATLTVPEPAADDGDFQHSTSATVVIPVNAAPTGTALAVVAELVPTAGGTSVAPTTVSQEDFVPLPSNVNAVSAEPLTVQFVDSAGNEVTGVTLNELATISMTVPTGDLFAADQDPQSVAVFKASDPTVGPWTELSTTFSIVGGSYRFQARTSSFSTFKLGSKIREIGIPAAGGAVLPSAGDIAPTNTQVILVTTLGLLLALGGGVYIRRQRKATSTE